MSLRDLPPPAALRAFAALAETRSVTQAGALLNVSHAAISQQVRNLESHLGLKLVARDGRGIALTADGAQLADVVRTAFHAIADEIAKLTGADADRPLQITTTPMFASSWLMPRLPTFRERHSEIDLLINPTPERVPLTPGGYDLAIRYGDGTWPGSEAEMLVETSFVIVAARRLIGSRKIERPADLLNFPWLQELGTDETTSWLARHGVTERRAKGMTSLPGNLLLDGVRAGQGVAATIRAFVEPEIRDGSIVVLFEEDTAGSGYHLVTLPGVLRPAARTFVRWLRREAGKEAAGGGR